jgi:hypothetical protein
MNLPLRILHEPGEEIVISVDGAFGARGLNLSHWPGNTTPRELKHDLSTGIALAFAGLPAARRDELARGATAIVSNHFDTDGAAAMFALVHPELALERADRLLDVAAAGDFFRLPSERARIIDLVVEGLVDAERSPWRDAFAGLSDLERSEHVLRELVSRFASLLDGDLEIYADLWRRELEDTRVDLADLAAAARDEVAHLDLCVWTAPEGRASSRASAAREIFDPGRHALFGTTRADRALVIGPRGGGASYRFVLSTLSWFDLVSRKTQPRPDLALLAERLNELERTSPADECAWRAQDARTPSPELWFGRADHALFAEHAPVLAESRLDPPLVRRAIADALRASWVFPDD